MDPLIQLVTQNQRNALDTTSKSSAGSHGRRETQDKDKASKTKGSKTAMSQGDLCDFSDDAMGGMNQELLGGGSEDTFLDYWSDDEEEEQERSEEEEREEENPPSHYDLREEDVEELDQGEWEDYRQPTVEQEEYEPEQEEELLESSEDSSLTDEEEPSSSLSSHSSGESQSWHSLLDPGEGILIDGTLGEARSQEQVASPEEACTSEVPLSIQELCSQLVDASRVLDQDFKKFQTVVTRFPLALLRLLVRENATVALCRNARELQTLAENQGAQEQVSQVFFAPSAKLIGVSLEVFEESYGTDNLFWVLGMAVDYTYGESSYASIRSTAVAANYERAKKELGDSVYNDSFALTTSAHYFATSLAALSVTASGGPCALNSLELFHWDVGMYSYLEYWVNRQ